MLGNDLTNKYDVVAEFGKWAVKLKKRTNHPGRKPFLTYHDKEVAGFKTIDDNGNVGLKVMVDGLVIPVELLNSMVIWWNRCKKEQKNIVTPGTRYKSEQKNSITSKPQRYSWR